MLDLTFVKKHLRIEHDEDDTYLSFLLATTTAEITALTGVANDASAPERYKLAVLLMLAHYYEHREATTATKRATLPYGLSYLIENLRQS
ncbi:head-tail connector protein [Rhodobacter capsulatus]|uniref:head-tail connector protein n=1 Tax=Rhodobacter capsulatus TaxID=1061 RepID=UPI0040267480